MTTFLSYDGDLDSQEMDAALRASVLCAADPASVHGLGATMAMTWWSNRWNARRAHRQVGKGSLRIGERLRALLPNGRAGNRVPEAVESIPVERLDELFREVQRHKWLEAEKAGHDIWTRRDPGNPDAVALRDWLAKHFEQWRSARG